MNKLLSSILAICATLLLVLLMAPVQAHAQGMDGLFGGNRNAFKISLKVIQCQPEDGIPEDLPGLPEPETHPACGTFDALELVDTTFTLLPGQKKAWEKTKPVPVSEQVYNAVLVEDEYQLQQENVTEKNLRAGYEMEVYIPSASRREAEIAMWVKHYSLHTDSEEMLLHSDGDVYLNPHARQIERLSVFKGELDMGETTIWGGKSVLRAPAVEDVPQIYPEDGRLWVEISLQK